MPKTRLLGGTLVLAGGAAMVLLLAVPASAATLPPGQGITIVDSYSWQFYGADPANAALTADGAPHDFPPNAPPEELTGIDVDDVGAGYAVGSVDTEAEQQGYVYTASAADQTVASPLPVKFVFIGEQDATRCDGIDYTGGEVWVACSFHLEELAQVAGVNYNFIGPVNLEDGMMTIVGDLTEDNEELVTAIARDPITGILWVFSTNPVGPIHNVFTLDESNQALDYQFSTAQSVSGADFDSGGQFWLTTHTPPPLAAAAPTAPYFELATMSLADGTFPFWAGMTIGGSPAGVWLKPITIWDKPPILPATGAAPPLPLVAGAAVLFLAGAVLLARQPRRSSL